MTNQNIIVASLVLCSLGGWYVVLTKYLELKEMIKEKKPRKPAEQHADLEPVSPDFNKLPDDFSFTGEHIPGMGPPPAVNLPFNIPDDLMQRARQAASMKMQQATQMNSQTTEHRSQEIEPRKNAAKPFTAEKRVVCNWATIMHLSGLAFITGIPFLNIIAPTILWLLKKEQHPYLEKQGREVINFQITFSLILFLCLGLGAIFIWLMPTVATALFAATKTVRVVFTTGMHLPFNMFTVVPFFWGCIVVVRGAVAAYHGFAYKYPGVQPFIFAGNMPPATRAPIAPKAGMNPNVKFS